MTTYLVTLVYEDGSTWFAGGFMDEMSKDTWINEEQTRPYWKATTQINVVEVITVIESNE